MIMNLIKRKLISCFLAGVLAVSVMDIVPSAEVYAKEIEEVRGERLFPGGGVAMMRKMLTAGMIWDVRIRPKRLHLKYGHPKRLR